jgi:transcriptional repressor NrdR
LACDRRFTTYERIEYVPITVIKRGGERESFDRSKLLRGIVTACEKTGISAHAIELMVDEIEARLQQQAVREVTSEEIGERVLAQLQQLSEVAYVRFASVYRQFRGIRDFAETLSQLQKNAAPARSQADALHPSDLNINRLKDDLLTAESPAADRQNSDELNSDELNHESERQALGKGQYASSLQV